jgi:hypothetical protein
MKDGRDVLDLLTRHPGTARNLCTKLCRRLVSDTPPQSVVDTAVAEWMAARSAPDQIKRVVRVILRSAEFRASWGQKVKRPFEAMVSYLRATGAELRLSDEDNATASYWGNIFFRLGETGQRIFDWPTPTGHPDVASYWLSTNGMLRRWNMAPFLSEGGTWGGNAALDLRAQTNAAVPGGSVTQIVDYWIGRLCGYEITPAVRQELIAFLAQGGDTGQPPRPTPRAPDWGNDAAITERIACTVQLLAMSPDYQYR